MNKVSSQSLSFDVVIIGGGIMGCSAALFLARSGKSVLVLEKHRVAGQQSGRNWGFIRSQDRDLAELPLSIAAQTIWKEWALEFGQAFNLRKRGTLYAAGDAQELDSFAVWQQSALEYGIQSEILDHSAFHKLVPGCTADPVGALYTPSDQQADPEAATIAISEAARDAGATILEDCGALRIATKVGHISGVETEQGFVSSEAVVCAAGATSHRLLSPLGIALPQQQVRNSVAQTQPLPDIIKPCFCGMGLGLRQRKDGRMVLTDEATCEIDVTIDTFRSARHFVPAYVQNRAAFDIRIGKPLVRDIAALATFADRKDPIKERAPHIPANRSKLDAALTQLKTCFPAARDAQIEKTWAGYIDVMPDALPVIEAHPRLEGLVIATGFSGHGFGLGPAIGKVVSELVSGQRSSIDLTPFASERFTRKRHTSSAKI